MNFKCISSHYLTFGLQTCKYEFVLVQMRKIQIQKSNLTQQTYNITPGITCIEKVLSRIYLPRLWLRHVDDRIDTLMGGGGALI